MFKIGDKAKGFKFDSGTDSVHYDNDMDDYVGEIGEVVDVYSYSFVILFSDQLEWMYPASLWGLAQVDETASFDVGEDMSFKVGDKVKFKKSSVDSGMIDAKEGDVFTVNGVYNRTVSLKELPGDYHKSHFEHYVEKEKVMEKYIPKVGDKVKGFVFEETLYPGIGYSAFMDKVIGAIGIVKEVYVDHFRVRFENGDTWSYPLDLAHLAKIEEPVQGLSHEDSHIDWQGSQINWQVGQEVWDVRYGRGIVETLLAIGSDYPIGVVFDDGGTASYTSKGMNRHTDVYRSLFFSEPKIIAETMPPKKPFLPTLKKGMDVLIKSKYAAEPTVWVVDAETEDRIYTSNGERYYMKQDIEYVRILGEQVKFS